MRPLGLLLPGAGYPRILNEKSHLAVCSTNTQRHNLVSTHSRECGGAGGHSNCNWHSSMRHAAALRFIPSAKTEAALNFTPAPSSAMEQVMILGPCGPPRHAFKQLTVCRHEDKQLIVCRFRSLSMRVQLSQQVCLICLMLDDKPASPSLQCQWSLLNQEGGLDQEQLDRACRGFH